MINYNTIDELSAKAAEIELSSIDFLKEDGKLNFKLVPSKPNA